MRKRLNGKLRAKAKSAIAWALIASMALPQTIYAGAWNQQNGKWMYEENGQKQTG